MLNLQAQAISLSGKVTNQSGKGVSGAIVTLKSKNLRDTTDAAGAYLIAGATATIHSTPHRKGTAAVVLKNGTVVVHLATPEQIRVELFDIQGKLLSQTTDLPATAGEYHFDIMKRAPAANMLVVKVSLGHTAAHFRIHPLSYRTSSVVTPYSTSSAGTIAKLQATVDTLLTSAAGYKVKQTTIASYEGTNDITLDTSIEVSGTCTASKPANMSVSGSGPHKVTVETNSGPGINEGTIYRPTDLGGEEKYPIFAWGEGGCSLDGKSNSVAMAEIASHGYFVIADGKPGGSGSRSMNSSDPVAMGKPLLAYITWAIAENRKPCSAYYQSLDTSKISTNGFSCGGLMSEGTAGDPRITTWALNSSGLFSTNQAFYKTIHTPVLLVEGGPSDMAYENGQRDYNGISPLGIPIMWFSKDLGHGGDLFGKNGGDFTKINLAWLNWWLKGDEGATGKGALTGAGCTFCSDKSWEVKSANLP